MEMGTGKSKGLLCCFTAAFINICGHFSMHLLVNLKILKNKIEQKKE